LKKSGNSEKMLIKIKSRDAEQMSSSEQQFLHDISTPLSTLVMIIENLQTDLEGHSTLTAEAGEARRAADVLLEISKQLRARKQEISSAPRNVSVPG
jgi:signal transduction histidine kinase